MGTKEKETGGARTPPARTGYRNNRNNSRHSHNRQEDDRPAREAAPASESNQTRQRHNAQKHRTTKPTGAERPAKNGNGDDRPEATEARDGTPRLPSRYDDEGKPRTEAPAPRTERRNHTGREAAPSPHGRRNQATSKRKDTDDNGHTNRQRADRPKQNERASEKQPPDGTTTHEGRTARRTAEGNEETAPRGDRTEAPNTRGRGTNERGNAHTHETGTGTRRRERGETGDHSKNGKSNWREISSFILTTSFF